MKKSGKKKWVIISLLALLVFVIGMAYFAIMYSGYKALDDMDGFPVPKTAELISEEENAKHYEWDGVSVADGIAKGYQLVIKNRGWKETDRQGETITYQQGDFVLQIQYEDGHFSVLEVEE